MANDVQKVELALYFINYLWVSIMKSFILVYNIFVQVQYVFLTGSTYRHDFDCLSILALYWTYLSHCYWLYSNSSMYTTVVRAYNCLSTVSCVIRIVES
jgi:hypothetical protein